MSDVSSVAVSEEVQARVAGRVRHARELLAVTVERREREVLRLAETGDPDDALVARTFNDFLRQVDEMRRNGAALVVATGPEGEPVVGRHAVLDADKEVVLVPWHAPMGQRQLLAPDRLLASELPDGSLRLHQLAADDVGLARDIRASMRAAAVQDRMSDPLATLTAEQGAVLSTVSAAAGDVVLTGPPGSGKSAIVMVELARRLLGADVPSGFRVLFVTGTPRLARRAEALTRLLGTASVTPVPQVDVLRVLGVTDADTPPAGDDDGDLALPRAIDEAFRVLAARLGGDDPVPHPLGSVPAGDIDAVVAVRARAATQSYRDSHRALSTALHAEYQQLVPGERSRAAADAAIDALRPSLTASALVDLALPGHTLPRPVRAAATAQARRLVEGGARSNRHDWDLVVVDEYQRLPDLVLGLLRRRAATVLLSGDPMQSFAGDDAASHLATTPVSLRTSLRLPAAVASWIDHFWAERDRPSPGIRTAVDGGRVEVVAPGADVVATVSTVLGAQDGPPAASAVIAPRRLAARHEDWLDAAEAVGLEWPHVVLVDPERIWDEDGPAGVFIGASRAIDHLTVVSGARVS